MKYKIAADYLGLTESALRQRKASGQIPADCWMMLGNSVRFDKVALDRWIEEMKAANN